jgi:hypothetical protein
MEVICAKFAITLQALTFSLFAQVAAQIEFGNIELPTIHL